MKTRLWGISILLLAAIMVLAACSPQPEVQPTMSETATEAPMEEAATQVPQEPTKEMEPTTSEMEPTQEMEAATAAPAELDVDALIKEKVAGNHDLDRIYNATKTREEWNATLDRMIGHGAKISEEEKQIIIDYLLSR